MFLRASLTDQPTSSPFAYLERLNDDIKFGLSMVVWDRFWSWSWSCSLSSPVQARARAPAPDPIPSYSFPCSTDLNWQMLGSHLLMPAASSLKYWSKYLVDTNWQVSRFHFCSLSLVMVIIMVNVSAVFIDIYACWPFSTPCKFVGITFSVTASKPLILIDALLYRLVAGLAISTEMKFMRTLDKISENRVSGIKAGGKI